MKPKCYKKKMTLNYNFISENILYNNYRMTSFKHIRGINRRRVSENLLSFTLHEQTWDNICNCQNCDHFGFPCLNCAEYFNYELGEGYDHDCPNDCEEENDDLEENNVNRNLLQEFNNEDNNEDNNEIINTFFIPINNQNIVFYHQIDENNLYVMI